jgi:hypothetical protein
MSDVRLEFAFGDIPDLTIARFCHIVARLGTQTELLLAFWTSIGFKPGDFITIGMNEKRTAWLCHVLNRVTVPPVAYAL